MRDQSVVLRNVRTQYAIRNLETHSMELDILTERDNGDVVGIEIQMYEETAPFKRTRYYLSGIDMSILEKGQGYDELPVVTMVYLTKEDIVGEGRGYYLIERRVGGQRNTICTDDKLQKKGVDIMCEIADRIREEGKNVGRIEGRIEDILELLEELGQIPQKIVDIIRAEENLGVLSRWLKSAARAGSIAEFEANM